PTRSPACTPPKPGSRRIRSTSKVTPGRSPETSSPGRKPGETDGRDVTGRRTVLRAWILLGWALLLLFFVWTAALALVQDAREFGRARRPFGGRSKTSPTPTEKARVRPPEEPRRSTPALEEALFGPHGCWLETY